MYTSNQSMPYIKVQLYKWLRGPFKGPGADNDIYFVLQMSYRYDVTIINNHLIYKWRYRP